MKFTQTELSYIKDTGVDLIPCSHKDAINKVKEVFGVDARIVKLKGQEEVKRTPIPSGLREKLVSKGLIANEIPDRRRV